MTAAAIAAWAVAPADAGTTVTSGALPLALAVAVLAGLVSFASPCVLPLVPGFLGYVTGLSDVELAQRSRARLVLGALLFVAGFTVVFVLSSIFVTTVGKALLVHHIALSRIGGLVVIAFAIVILRGSATRSAPIRWRPRAGLLGAPLLGAVFALGWSPCIGPVLGAVLTMASATVDPNVGRAAVLTTAYCLGLGLPLIVIAAGVERFGRVSGWLRRHQRTITRIGGLVLLLVGILLVTGVWEDLNRWIQRELVLGYQVVL